MTPEPQAPEPEPAAAPTPPAPARAQRQPTAADAFWNVVGVLFAWVVVTAVWQKGPSGYVGAFVMLLGVMLAVGAGALLVWALQRYAAPMAALGLLALWWGWGGSYAPGRDALLATLVAGAVLLIVPASRLWLRRQPRRWRGRWRLWRRSRRFEASEAGHAAREANAQALQGLLQRGASSVWAKVRRSATAPRAPAAPAPQPVPLRPRVSPAVLATAAVAVWAALSAADAGFESHPLPRRGTVLQPPGMPALHAPLRVGLALSGGGYRAALVHAGVVDALGDLGLPVTHLSAVSGGSIIGSFLSVGGAPRDFVDAVAEGRFRMTRDLLAAQYLVRLPSPTVLPGLDVDIWPLPWPMSRTDVQANLVDRVLLAGAQPGDLPRRGPRLMVCMTDLNHGLSVGATDDGVLLVGPTVARYFRTGQAIDFPALPRLADRVAVSGAFPGAFPALPVTARIVGSGPPATLAAQGSDLPLQLADGGVRDNLGLTLLEAMDRQARQAADQAWVGHRPDADWQLDLILVSDGGKFLQAAAPEGTLGSTLRAIDLSGLATGVLRPFANGEGPPRVLLSALGTVAPSPDAAVLGQTQAQMRDAHHAYFRPDTLGDDVVARLIGLQGEPTATRLRAAWAQHRQHPRGPVNLSTLEARCGPGANADPKPDPDPDCAWWTVVSTVGDDIWRSTQAFANTPTLSDRYTPEQARTIHRFGQYLVLLRAVELRGALSRAVAKRLPAN